MEFKFCKPAFKAFVLEKNAVVLGSWSFLISFFMVMVMQTEGRSGVVSSSLHSVSLSELLLLS